MKQSSDHMNAGGGKAAGTKVTGLSPRETSCSDLGPTTTNPSGSSQGDSRGLREHTRGASAGSNG